MPLLIEHAELLLFFVAVYIIVGTVVLAFWLFGFKKIYFDNNKYILRKNVTRVSGIFLVEEDFRSDSIILVPSKSRIYWIAESARQIAGLDVLIGKTSDIVNDEFKFELEA